MYGAQTSTFCSPSSVTGDIVVSKMSPPKVVYTYFDARARGELPRLIMKAGGIEFEDKRLDRREWSPELKQSKFWERSSG